MKVLQQTGKFILYAAILAGFTAVFIGSGVMDLIDRGILLEYTHPAYYEISSSSVARKVPYDYYLNGTANKIVNNLSTYESERGFMVTVNADGSLTYAGTNNGEDNAYVGITNSTWSLSSGSYVLSDSKIYCQTGAPISTSDFKLNVMARRYHVGGETEYISIVDASDVTKRFFTVDYSQYNDYYVQLVIAPGYTSEGITIYPMLTTYEERTEDYQPAFLSNASAYTETGTYCTTYTRMQTSKESYLALSARDHQRLMNYVRYQAPVDGVWTMIDFGDGTGLYFPQNDPAQVQYGQLNLAGQMELLYGDEDFIVLTEHPLNETDELDAYLQMLNNPDYTILMAIRDDGVASIRQYQMALLEELGVRTPLTERSDADNSLNYYRHSYYAVLNPGQASVEEASDTELNYSGTTRDGRHTFSIHSCGWGIGDGSALIQIDGTEYSMNRRGLNIVVYDNATGAVIDNVTFDTNSSLRACRELQTVETQ